MMTEEIRAFPRVALEFKVEYSVLSGFGAIKLIESYTLDFSVSGAKIETTEVLKSGDQLSVRIEVPDLNSYQFDQEGQKKYGQTVVMCFGLVRWVGSPENGKSTAGIRFSGMTARDRSYLSRLLDEKSAKVVD